MHMNNTLLAPFMETLEPELSERVKLYWYKSMIVLGYRPMSSMENDIILADRWTLDE